MKVDLVTVNRDCAALQRLLASGYGTRSRRYRRRWNLARKHREATVKTVLAGYVAPFRETGPVR